jgi:EpsI family protein
VNILFTLLLLSGIGVLYFDTFVRIGKNLFTYESSHGLLILAVSFYLIWQKRDQLKRLPVRPNLIYGLILTVFGCFLFLSGKLSSTNLLQQISLIATLLGVIWLTLGGSYFRALLVPVGYLIFMFGFFDMLFGNISIYLQSITAWIAFNLLKPTGMPVFLKGQVIELSHISLEVVRECNGINHIVSLVALSVPLAIMTQRTLIRKTCLILIAVLIGIFANGLRVALIGIWTYFNRSGPSHGPFDTLYVSFIFFFGMGLLFLISRLLTRPSRKPQVSNGKEGKFEVGGLRFEATNNSTNPINSSNPSNFNLVAFLVGILILLSSISFSYFYEPKPVYLRDGLTTFPTTIEGWAGQDVAMLEDEIFRGFSAHEELKRVYTNTEGHKIKLYIGYFPTQKQSEEMVDYRLDWLHDQPDTIWIRENGMEIPIKKAAWRDRKNSKHIYFWYNINGRSILDPYKAKLVTALDAFIKRRNNGAVILIIVDRNWGEDQSEHLQFLQAVFPIIQNHLNQATE